MYRLWGFVIWDLHAWGKFQNTVCSCADGAHTAQMSDWLTFPVPASRSEVEGYYVCQGLNNGLKVKSSAERVQSDLYMRVSEMGNFVA